MNTTRIISFLATAVVIGGSAILATLFCVIVIGWLCGAGQEPPFVPLTVDELGALGLPDAFEVPTEPLDQHRNPVWRSRDKATGLPRQIRHKATGMHLMFIPAGAFQMGSNAGQPNEKPVHEVTISRPFYMGRYEVTQAEWQAVMGLPAAPGKAQAGENPSQFKGESNPVESVSWDDCQEFIKRLNDGLSVGAGLAPPSGAQQAAPLHFSLPTEAPQSPELPSPPGRGAGLPAAPAAQAGGEGGSYPRFSLPTEAQQNSGLPSPPGRGAGGEGGGGPRFSLPTEAQQNSGLPSTFGRGAGGEGGSYPRFSLPTEAQWEHACRAGTDTEWFWGDEEARVKQYANSNYTVEYRLWRWKKVYDDGFPGVAPVGQFRANGFGLYDMAGNVWEWCQDWYAESYDRRDAVDPTGPQQGAYRVLRGGSCALDGASCRSASRSRNRPDGRGWNPGFRLVLAVGSVR